MNLNTWYISFFSLNRYLLSIWYLLAICHSDSLVSLFLAPSVSFVCSLFTGPVAGRTLGPAAGLDLRRATSPVTGIVTQTPVTQGE